MRKEVKLKVYEMGTQESCVVLVEDMIRETEEFVMYSKMVASPTAYAVDNKIRYDTTLWPLGENVKIYKSNIRVEYEITAEARERV